MGAGITAALTPVTGNQLRKLLVDLINENTGKKLDESVDNQLDRMTGEGGVSHEVAPPVVSGKAFESHS